MLFYLVSLPIIIKQEKIVFCNFLNFIIQAFLRNIVNQVKLDK